MAILGAPSLKKILKYVADMKTFSKRCLRLLGLTSLCLVSTQPNSKFHPPATKIFWIRSRARDRFFLTPPSPFEICWVRPW